MISLLAKDRLIAPPGYNWLLVGIPLASGIYRTLRSAIVLFR
jgi:hypothetical protein